MGSVLLRVRPEFFNLLLPQFRELLVNCRHDHAPLFVHFICHAFGELARMPQDGMQHFNHVFKRVEIIIQQDDMPRGLQRGRSCQRLHTRLVRSYAGLARSHRSGGAADVSRRNHGANYAIAQPSLKLPQHDAPAAAI